MGPTIETGRGGAPTDFEREREREGERRGGGGERERRAREKEREREREEKGSARGRGGEIGRGLLALHHFIWAAHSNQCRPRVRTNAPQHPICLIRSENQVRQS